MQQRFDCMCSYDRDELTFMSRLYDEMTVWLVVLSDTLIGSRTKHLKV